MFNNSLSPLVFKDTVTLYSYYYDKNLQKHYYKRTVLKNVFWKSKRISNNLEQGISVVDNVIIYIPKDDYYINTDIWKNLKFEKIKKYWTLGLGGELLPSVLVKGICDFEFKPSSKDNIEIALEKLKEKSNHKTVITFEECFYGSEELHHIKVLC